MSMPKKFWSGGFQILLLNALIGAIVGAAVGAFINKLPNGAMIGAVCGALIAIPEYLLAMFHSSASDNVVTNFVHQLRLFAFICLPVFCICLLLAVFITDAGATYLDRATTTLKYGSIVAAILFIFVKVRNSMRAR